MCFDTLCRENTEYVIWMTKTVLPQSPIPAKGLMLKFNFLSKFEAVAVAVGIPILNIL